MEKLDLRNPRSQMKVMGTLISGAMIVTLCKGPPIMKTLRVQSTMKNTFTDPSKFNPSFSTMLMTTSNNNWVIGGPFLAIGSLSYAISNTAQVHSPIRAIATYYNFLFFFFIQNLGKLILLLSTI